MFRGLLQGQLAGRTRGGSARKLAQSPSEPTVLQDGPYRLFFFSSDRGEPVHVHVARDRKAAKFWMAPVRLEYNHGFPKAELARVEALVRKHEDAIQRAWHEHFGRN